MLSAGIASLMLLFAPLLAMKIMPEVTLLPVLPYALFYCFLISGVAHYFVVKSVESQSKNFINVFMGTMGIKLMFFFGFIILYSFTHRKEAVPFLVWFMIYYIVFTALDVVFLLIQNNQMLSKSK